MAKALSAALCAVSLLWAEATAQVSLPEAVEAEPLAKDAFSTGTLTAASGALGPDLWKDADAATLEFLLSRLPTRPAAPSLGDALRRVLLSPGERPAGGGAALGGRKLLALAEAGFVEDARTIASLSSEPRGDAWTGRAEAVAALLAGDSREACRRSERLQDGRDEPFWVKLRIFCYAEAGERDAADLTLGILRDRGGLTESEETLLTAAATGAAPKTPPAPRAALEYAIARSLELPFDPEFLALADGGVLRAVGKDPSFDLATRIDAAERAVAMGVAQAGELEALFESASVELAELGDAAAAARERAGDPVTDAVLFQSVATMNAPEFLRDKAQRIALALSIAESFPRAYALSVLYADDIEALEGALLSPAEAARFAQARMAVGDSVGAARWLSAMLGPDVSVSALPEDEALTFIELVNLLAVLDPATARRIADAASVSLEDSLRIASTAAPAPLEAAASAQVIEAAFDAALGDKPGQAGLAALAASAGLGGSDATQAVIVAQSLRAAGLADLQRRYAFERAWAATLGEGDPANGSARAREDGFTPRVKPASN